MLNHIGTQVIVDKIRIPLRRGRQPLHPVWGALTGRNEPLPIVRVPHLLRWRRSLAVCDSQCGANVAARVVTAVGGQKAGGRY